MSSHPDYANPPIAEVALEVRFACAWKDDLSVLVQERFSALYTGAQRTVPRLGESAPTTATLLTSEDGTRFVGLAPSILTIHALGRYPGWEAFALQANEAIDLYIATTSPEGITRITVRYIDRISLPGEGADIREYFTCVPGNPLSLPQTTDGFHLVLKGVAPDGLMSLLTVAYDAADDNEVIYDINLTRKFTPKADLGSWRQMADQLHDQQRQIFEDSITEKTRELFK